jgi:hypothetical protein
VSALVRAHASAFASRALAVSTSSDS